MVFMIQFSFLFSDVATEECIGDLVWNDCGSPCTATCDNYKDLVCIERCDRRCECPRDRPILRDGRCIKEEQCPGKHLV